MAEKKLLASLSGIVTAFEGNGRKLGYPTANLKATLNLQEGVYFGFAGLAEYSNHPALIFVGKPVTVGAAESRVEAHLLNIANKDYYGQTMALSICYFHRLNKHFSSIEALLVAMQADEVAARAWFNLQTPAI